MSFMEAMSQGCAAVCFKIHGVITEISQNGKCCLLVDDGDVDSFKIKTKELMQSDYLREQLSKAGVNLVRDYTVDNITKKWEKLCYEIINQ
jgi:glycosyltransferase involved in cell wall biosynthesis